MWIKRCFDLCGALIGLALLTPLLAVVACWIKLDSRGPVFFRQLRIGRYGLPFRIFKFRTMKTGTEERGPLTRKNDARITFPGKFLRYYKIDELPQLINVLLGEMSFVGPRPEVPRYLKFYPPDVRRLILSVSPGITDWASIEFKNESELLGEGDAVEDAYVTKILPVKIDYYVRYVNRRSFLTDLRIIFTTLVAIVR